MIDKRKKEYNTYIYTHTETKAGATYTNDN